MTGQNNFNYSYSNKLSRIFLLSIEEIIGHTSMNAVLNQADLRGLISNYPPDDLMPSIHFDEISRIQVSLEQLYGPRGGRGLALRSGRVFFTTGLREFGEELRTTDHDFRLLPLDRKIIAGLEALVKIFNDHSDQRVTLEVLPEQILWIIERCPFCWARTADTHVCYMEVGMLQEALFWVSGGKYYLVEEVECKAMGDSVCTIAIAKNSLD
jgi:predicted hydrocarbon binding protein